MIDVDCNIKEYELLKLVEDTSGMGFFELIIETGKIYYSFGCKTMLGYLETEFPDDSDEFIKKMDNESKIKYMNMQKHALAELKTSFEFDIKVKHKNDYWINVLVKGKILKGAEENIHRIIGTHTDITSIKEAETILRLKTLELQDMLDKYEKQRIANLVILNDFNKTTKKLRAEIDINKKIQADLVESHKQLRKLSHHLQKSREEQNAYIAREIHDDLGQELTALEMMLTLLEDSISGDTPVNKKTESLKNEIRWQLDSVVEKTRKLTLDLRPVILDTYNLDEAVIWLAEQCEKNTKIPISKDIKVKDLNLGADKNVAVFRVFQEAFNNIAKYSKADNVKISIEKNENILNFSIKDNGCGFNTNGSTSGISFGIMNMQERVLFCEGDFEIISNPGNGTEIIFSLPYYE